MERLVSNAYALAKDVLQKNKTLLYALAERLVDQETVTAEEFALMLLDYDVQMVPYAVYPNENKVDELPYYPDQMPDFSYGAGTNIRFNNVNKAKMEGKADGVMSGKALGSGAK